MFFWDFEVDAFRFRLGLCFSLEFGGEGFVVEECPWVVELVVPGSFQILHC